jgi:hypothetical protein
MPFTFSLDLHRSSFRLLHKEVVNIKSFFIIQIADGIFSSFSSFRCHFKFIHIQAIRIVFTSTIYPFAFLHQLKLRITRCLLLAIAVLSADFPQTLYGAASIFYPMAWHYQHHPFS